MSNSLALDAVIIGYNEMPFEQYEALLQQYGEESEAYRDLKFNFVELHGKKLNYVELMNYAFGHAYNQPDFNEFKSAEIPNLAAVYLTNFLNKRGYTATYVNLFQYEKDKLINLLKQNPSCVAITTTFYVINQPVIEMVQFIREHNPQIKIVVGGPLVSNHHRLYSGEQLAVALDDIGADIYVVESQGEQTLADIITALQTDGDISQVPNLFYKDELSIMSEVRGYRATQRVPENNDMNEVSIDWTEFPQAELGPTLQTRTARSCAFSCAFCGYPGRAGKLTLTDLDVIEQELDAMYSLGYVKNVVFIDDTFNVPLERFKQICQLMIRKNYQFNWFSYFRCSNSDEEAIELMAQSGCKGVFLGIESGSPRVLKEMHKAATIEKYSKGIGLLKKHNIITFGSFITGFPSEDQETVDETLEFIKTYQPDFYRTMLWYCEPGTPVYARREKYNIAGEGFKWEHDTMDSLEAMDHIDRIFLSVDPEASIWLPQWSFDFWFIPYILGKGISIEQFKDFTRLAYRLLALDIAYVPAREKEQQKEAYFQELVRIIASWQWTPDSLLSHSVPTATAS